MLCDGDCFNCKFDDCILTDRELARQMRAPKKKVEKKEKAKAIKKSLPKQANRIGKLKGEFKLEYILTPLPGSPESERRWGVNNDES